MIETNNIKQAKDDSSDIEMTETSYKTTHTAVRKARRFAVQGIYEWLMTDRRFEQNGYPEWKANSPHDIAARTRATNAMHTVHIGYYHEMMRDIPQEVEELDELISAQLDRDISRLDIIEHAILLIGAYEMKKSLQIPYKVVLDESMKLNTHFGGTDAHKLINAVLDKIAKQVRVAEIKAAGTEVDKVAVDGVEVNKTEAHKATETKESDKELGDKEPVDTDSGADVSNELSAEATAESATESNSRPTQSE